MKFNTWMSQQDTYVDIEKVLHYLNRKNDIRARVVEKELQEMQQLKNVKWVPSAIYTIEGEDYDF